MQIPDMWRKALLGDGTSKCNKLWLAIELQRRGYWLEWDWNPSTVKGLTDPVRFRFSPDDKWIDSKSYDERYQAMKDPKK